MRWLGMWIVVSTGLYASITPTHTPAMVIVSVATILIGLALLVYTQEEQRGR